MQTVIQELTVLDVLRKVRALFSDPDRWIQGHMAETRDGEWGWLVMPNSTYRYSSIGAIWHSATTGNPRLAHAAIDAVTACLPEGSGTLTQFNHSKNTTLADVVALFDRAIAAQEAAESAHAA